MTTTRANWVALGAYALLQVACQGGPNRYAEPALYAEDLAPSLSDSIVTAGGKAGVSYRVGSLSGPEDAFGRIRDAIDLGDHSLLVLDEQALSVEWFDEGSLVSATQAGGRGPGSLRSPTALVRIRDHLIVPDGVYSKWVEYQLLPDSIAFLKEVALPFPLDDACEMGGIIYGTSPQAFGLVHAFGLDGNLIHSFGDFLPPGPELPFAPSYLAIISRQQNTGEIDCIRSPARLAFMHRELPVVRLFDIDGRELWTSELSGYHAMGRQPGPSGRGVMDVPDPESGSVHNGFAIAHVEEQLLLSLLETGLVHGRQGPDLIEVPDLRVLDVRTGEELNRMSPFPMIVVAASVEGILGYTNDPIPRVLLYDSIPRLHRFSEGTGNADSRSINQ